MTAHGPALLPVQALGLDRLRGATLAQVDAAAALQHRVDRKYLAPAAAARDLVTGLANTHHVLDLDDGRRTTTYRSTYFDTPALDAWRAHVQGRRRRWKVRTRLYAEDLLCRIEVKTKDGRGATVKHALRARADDYGHLGVQAAAFVDAVLADAGIPVTAETLTAAAEVIYARAALADLDAGSRVTLDTQLAIHRGGRSVLLDPGYVLVETKGGNRPASADRLLTALGVRPVSVSKYVVGLSQLIPGLPDNPIRRLARTHFHIPPGAAERNSA